MTMIKQIPHHYNELEGTSVQFPASFLLLNENRCQEIFFCFVSIYSFPNRSHEHRSRPRSYSCPSCTSGSSCSSTISSGSGCSSAISSGSGCSSGSDCCSRLYCRMIPTLDSIYRDTEASILPLLLLMRFPSSTEKVFAFSPPFMPSQGSRHWQCCRRVPRSQHSEGLPRQGRCPALLLEQECS